MFPSRYCRANLSVLDRDCIERRVKWIWLRTVRLCGLVSVTLEVMPNEWLDSGFGKLIGLRGNHPNNCRIVPCFSSLQFYPEKIVE